MTFQQDAYLIQALLHMYSVNEDVFKFENFSLYLGLEDILCITGLPIDVKPITCINTNDGEECNKFWSISNCIYHKNKIRNDVKLSWLKKNFERVPGAIKEDNLNFVYYVRAYVLFLIGTIILPDASVHAVQTHYLQLLEKIEDIGKYAWGDALLGHLKCSIKRYKRHIRSDRKQSCSSGKHTCAAMLVLNEHLTGMSLKFFELYLNLYLSFTLYCSWVPDHEV